MGIAGAGNSGTVMASLFVPRLAGDSAGRGDGLAALPMLLAAVVFVACAKDSPRQPAPSGPANTSRCCVSSDTLWFCFFYAITFGGFVGLASFLSVFFHDQYGVDR